MPTVKFQVQSDLDSFFAKANQRSKALSDAMIANAQNESKVASDQLKIFQEQLTTLDRRNKLSHQISGIVNVQNLTERVKNTGSRDNVLDKIYQNLLGKKERGEITEEVFNKKTSSLDVLSNRNSTSGIIGEYKEFLVKQSEQLREQSLTNKLTKENIEAVRQGVKDNIKTIKQGDATIEQVLEKATTPTEQLAAQITKEKLEKEKNGGGNGSQTGNWTQFLKALAFEKGIGLFAGLPGAKNELDMVRPLTSFMGMAAGGFLGNTIDMADIKIAGTGLGQTNYGALGTALGQTIGESVGTALERSFRSRDELTVSNFRLQALLGNNLGINNFADLSGSGMAKNQLDLSRYGLDYIASSNLEAEIALKQGSGKGIGRQAENIMAAQQGLGVSKEISMSLIELSRSSKENESNFLKTLQGVLISSQNNILKGDRAFLGELVGLYTKLHKTLLQGTGTVGGGTVMGLLNNYHSMGGMFDLKDFRSMPLIETINNSMRNPQSEAIKGMMFLALRRAMPKANSYQVMEEMQKGSGSDLYRKAAVDALERMGGSNVSKMWQSAAIFGMGDNLAANSVFFRNRRSWAGGIDKSLPGGVDQSEEAIRQMGQGQTSPYSVSTAEITNEFIKSTKGGMSVLESRMKNMIDNVFDNLDNYIAKKLGFPVPDRVTDHAPQYNGTHPQKHKPEWMKKTTPTGRGYQW